LLLAVKLGTPIGDVSALASINVAISAFFGFLFLGEKLQRLHYLATIFSMVGAFLIAKPSFIFGADPNDDDTAYAWLGYILAPLSGLLDACVLVFSRKAPEAPTTYTAGFYYIQICIVLMLLPLATARVVVPERWSLIAANPGASIGWISLLSAIDMPSLCLFMIAARRCPAAVSATISVGARMVSGYFVQVIFFGDKLEPLTVTGAVLMLAGVVAMALIPTPESNESSPEQDATAKKAVQDEEHGESQNCDSDGDVAASGSTVAPSSDSSGLDGVESVASFGSSVEERSENSNVPQVSGPSENSLQGRLRTYFKKTQEHHHSTPVSPIAETIGAAASSTTTIEERASVELPV